MSKQDIKTTQDKIANSLRKAILTGEFKHGDRIVQEDLARRFGVSRMPIREALKKLEFEGIVKIVPMKGAIACPVTIEDIEEIYTLRSMNESLAVEKALPYINNDDIKELESILNEMENIHLTDETFKYYFNLNEKFHNKLIEKCPWRRVVQNAKIFWGHYLSIGTTTILKGYYEKVKREHRQIFEAVCMGDVKLLKRIIEYHIERNMNDLISELRK